MLRGTVRPQRYSGIDGREGVDGLGLGVGARGERRVQLDVHDGLGGSEQYTGGSRVKDAQEHRAVLSERL